MTHNYVSDIAAGNNPIVIYDTSANYLFARVSCNVLQYIWLFKLSTQARNVLIPALVRESSTIRAVNSFYSTHF